ARRRQGEGLDQELQQNVARLGADGHAQADLPRPLGDADQHDVHDANAANEQRDGGDARQEQAQRPGALLARLRDLGQVPDRKSFSAGFWMWWRSRNKLSISACARGTAPGETALT